MIPVIINKGRPWKYKRLTQSLQTVSSTPDSDLVPTQRLDVTVPFGVHSEMPQYYTAQRQVQLSQVKTTEIQQHARSKDVNYIRETGSGDMGTVRCQCGWNGEEPEMVSVATTNRTQVLNVGGRVCFLSYTSTPALLRFFGLQRC